MPMPSRERTATATFWMAILISSNSLEVPVQRIEQLHRMIGEAVDFLEGELTAVKWPKSPRPLSAPRSTAR